MCGIIGYVGETSSIERVVKGLEILEYRGYDSAGVCSMVGNEFRLAKVKGRVGELKARLEKEPIEDMGCAIGHTRWATHGAPSDINAHPHVVGGCALVHNGIIENYKELKAELSKEGVAFLSETDTEVACALINRYFERDKDPCSAILRATERMKGSYAFGIMLKGIKDTVFAVRRGSPLIVGRGKDGYYLSSDLTSIIPFTREYYPLNEGEIVSLSRDGVKIYGKGEPKFKVSDMSVESSRKGGYEHFMLKEMFEQPEAIRRAISPRVNGGLPDFSCDGIEYSALEGISGVQIVACGSAMHAGLMAAPVIEGLCALPCTVHIASEYRYSPPFAKKGTLVIVISQSGETADSIASLRDAKRRGLTTLGIVNAVETTIAREADFCAYTYAGQEIAVATTKGYTTQVALLYLFASWLGLNRGIIDQKTAKDTTDCLLYEVPRVAEEMLRQRERVMEIAGQIYNSQSIFYIGRGLDYALAQEAALKLKEISYIHCEAYAAGELKHGTISLIEKETPVIAISTEEALFDKIDNNVREVGARGALCVLICAPEMAERAQSAQLVLKMPKGSRIGTAIGAVMAVQMIAYETARLRGCDIDKPRNLAKSVTVE